MFTSEARLLSSKPGRYRTYIMLIQRESLIAAELTRHRDMTGIGKVLEKKNPLPPYELPFVRE